MCFSILPSQVYETLGQGGTVYRCWVYCVIFCAWCLNLDALRGVVCGLGLFFGVVYSVPPFRLRKTPYKPIVNFTVGAVPVMIIAAFFNAFSINVVTLDFVNRRNHSHQQPLGDLADYASDFNSGSRTLPIILGFRRGLLFTVAMGYVMIPLMVLVGVLFGLPLVYYAALVALAGFVTLRLVQKRMLWCR